MLGPKVSRQEAIRLGLRMYFTGKQCPMGHVTYRMVNNFSCIDCRKYAVRRYRARDPQHVRDLGKKYYYEGGKDKQREKMRKFRERRPDYYKEWNDRNREKLSEYGKRYVKKHPEKAILKWKTRGARRRNAPGRFTKYDLAEILQMQKGRCAYCRRKILGQQFHVDHIVPLAGGGTNHRTNIQATCPDCNLKKRALDPIVFAQQKGMLL